MKSANTLLLVLFSTVSMWAQFPVANFNINASSCLNENLLIDNNSSNADMYEWDFCLGDFSQLPLIQTNLSSNISVVNGLKIIEDSGVFYGFGLNNTKLYRFDFGTDISNMSPVVTDLGDLGVISNVEGIDIVKEGTQWVGITGFGIASNGGNFIRLVWTDLNLPPTAESIGNFGFTGRVREVQLLRQGSNYIMAAPYWNDNELIRIDFGNSMLNTPSMTDVYSSPTLENVSRPIGMSIVKKQGNWQVIVGSILTKTISLFDLGSDLLSPTTHVKSETFASFNNLTKVKVIRDGTNYYGFVSTSNGVLRLIDLKTLDVTDTFEEVVIADMPIVSGIDIIKKGSSHYVFGVQTKLQRLFFESICHSSTSYSSLEVPNLSFLQSANYDIDLIVRDNQGNFDFITKTIAVSGDQTPSIASSSQNVCLSNPINFTSSSDQTITTYTWNFGDTNTSSDPNPSHTYSTTGEYEVMVDVTSSNGCHNFTKQMITVYDEPVPNFTLPSGATCTNEDYTFVNNTIDNFDGNLTYEWQVDDQIVGTQRELTHQFVSEGAKEIKLIASISGCDIEQVQNIANVSLGAVPLYSYDVNNTCLSDPISFINQSTGTGITDYMWNFGDSNTSTEVNPSHTYSTVGTHQVSLEVINAAGCVTTYQEEVIVQSLPNTDFLAELACTNDETQFSDLSMVDNANITTWDWNFGDISSGSANVSSEENPTHIFSNTGDFDVTLSATSNFGCESTTVETVTVLEGPEVDFEVDFKCVGDAFLFSDTSVPNSGGRIISRAWNINGGVYTVQNPSHTFSSAGTFAATLTIRSNNLCTISSTQMITVNELPTVDFSLNSNCANTEVSLEDQSILMNDDIVNWQWTVNGQDAGNTLDISYVFDQAGTQQIELRIITERGCIISKSENIEFFDLPTADFEPSPQYSSSPAMINFNNISKNAISYEWNFGDGNTNSIETSPNHTYTDLGSYDVSLTAHSAEGCTDDIIKQIHVVNPQIDLSIDEITTFNNGENLLLTISNKGTVPVNELTATVSLNNKISIKETFDLNILPNQTSISRSLSFAIPENGRIEFLCISLSTSEGVDINSNDNTHCINIDSDFEILDPFPSPVSRQEVVTLPLIGEKNDKVTIALMNASGKQFFLKNTTLSQTGLNNFDFSLFSLKPGIYFIRVQFVEISKSFRIFVN